MSHAKSRAEHDYQGTTDKRSLRNPPKVQHKYLQVPSNLGKVACQHWKDVVPSLVKAGIATTLDKPMLAAMCKWYQLWCEASENPIDDYSSTNGKRQLDAIKTAWSEYSKIATQFGLTPVSRNVVSVAPPVDNEDGDDFLS